jgi:hypothetical protein
MTKQQKFWQRAASGWTIEHLERVIAQERVAIAEGRRAYAGGQDVFVGALREKGRRNGFDI